MSAPNVQVVLPGDSRVRVADSSASPFRWVGHLTTKWRDGSTSTGTATLWDDRYLLTCAHNLFDSVLGSATGAEFRPALNRNATGRLVAPYGPFPVAGFGVPIAYKKSPPVRPPAQGVPQVEITRYLWDYAVARLGGHLPEDLANSPFTIPATPDGVRAASCQIIGYSGDRDTTASTQFERHGQVRVDSKEEFVTYRMSTYQGDSGAVVAYQPPSRPWWTVAGIHVSGTPDSNQGAADGLNFGPAWFDADVVQGLRDQADL